MAKKDQEEKQEHAPQKDQNKKAEQAASKDKQSESTVDELKKQLAELKKQIADKDDQFLRAEAEIQNMSKRFEKERSQMAKYDGQDLAKSILPVLDNL